MPSHSSTVELLPRRHYGQWVAVAAVSVFAAWLVFQLIVNEAFQWPVVAEYLFSPRILEGISVTIFLTILAMSLSIVLGLIIAVMKLSSNPLLNAVATAYLWFFRGVPTLVQLVFWFNMASLFPRLELGIPFGGPKFWGMDMNDFMTPLLVAVVGLGIAEGALMAEIIRGGILSVGAGQMHAALAIGMKPWQTLRLVILPQAMRAIIPASGNQVIGMLKWTSLASTVALGELLLAAQTIYQRNFQVIPLLIVASIWYLVMTTILTFGQRHLERYYNRGSAVRHVKKSRRGGARSDREDAKEGNA